ncbi:MAG TPA: hypothetical protein VNB22_10510 [Pyrinomonadaceae bacterium]|nr:hypothetical protein [Pyrinomonadaceae bacterium]
MFFYGGTGGGATHGSATGAGLVQASGETAESVRAAEWAGL